MCLCMIHQKKKKRSRIYVCVDVSMSNNMCGSVCVCVTQFQTGRLTGCVNVVRCVGLAQDVLFSFPTQSLLA